MTVVLIGLQVHTAITQMFQYVMRMSSQAPVLSEEVRNAAAYNTHNKIFMRRLAHTFFDTSLVACH